MKNNKIFIIIGAVILAGIITYLIYNKQQTNKVVGPVPNSTEQKDFDSTFDEVEKVKPKSIESIKLPDKISSSFEQISGNMLGFVGNDGVIYTINLETNETKSYELSDDIFNQEVKFVTFDSDFKSVMLGFENYDKLALMDLESKNIVQISLPSPMAAYFYKETYYVLSSQKALKLSAVKNNSAQTITTTSISSEEGQLTELDGEIVIITSNGTYREDGRKLSKSSSLIYGKDNANLVLLTENEEDMNLEIYKKNLTEEKKISTSLPVKSIYLPGEKTILLTLSISEDVNDKLIKMDFDGNESEIVLPDVYPDFLREYKFDKVLFANNSAIYYADQGNVFKINL